jgi:fumarate reductase subunit C
MQEDESDLIIDLYTIYAVLWGKYVFYLSFILEEFARVGLALFVTYILMFEINAVNRSRNEDFYFAAKR